MTNSNSESTKQAQPGTVYPPQYNQGYPPQSGQGYPPQSGQSYPPQSGQGYPPQSGQGYPPKTNHITPSQSNQSYPPPSNQSYPPQSNQGYSPQFNQGYPPQSNQGYPPQTGQGYSPQSNVGGYPPQNNQGYPPKTNQGYPPQTNQGYPPAYSQGYPPQSNQSYPPVSSQGYPPQTTNQGYPPQSSQPSQAPVTKVPASSKELANLKWITSTNGDIPPMSIPGGWEKNGDKLYVARAFHGASLVVGKCAPHLNGLMISFGGTEYLYKEYEALTGAAFNLKWIEFSGKFNPKDHEFIQGGYEEDGTKLYIGKTIVDDCEVLGKVGTHFDTGMVFGYDTKEFSVEEGAKYSVLCYA